MTLSIGIIIPGWHYWADPTRIQPMYELYYATVIDHLFPDGQVTVQMHDMRGIRADQQVSHIPRHDLYVYWIMKAGDYTEVTGLVADLRSAYPQSIHAAGGVHVDACPDDAMIHFDAVMVGPGERSLERIIRLLLDNEFQKQVLRLDYADAHYGDYPFMRRHYLPESAVIKPVLFQKYGPDIPSTCVQFSRGCCYQCIYCVYNIPDKIQMRRMSEIRAEIDYLKKNYGIAAINLKDEVALPPVEKQCRSFLETLGESDIKWRGQTTIWKAGADMLRLAGQSGCLELACGVESASAQVRKILKKPVSDDDIHSFIENCHRNGIKVKMCLILGLPGESRDIVRETIRFIERMQPDFVSISGLDPFPGSRIYEHPEAYGIKFIDEDWGKHTHLLYRFSDEEEGGIPFEYHAENQWGRTFNRAEIVSNIQQLQGYCREQNMLY